MVFEAVWFAHPSPTSSADHVRFFGAPVTFDAPSDRLLFAPTLLDAPLFTAAPVIAQTLARRLQEIERADEGDPLVRRLRKMVSESLGTEDLDITTAASRLAVSRRSLQRHLRKNRTSFREIVDEIRRARADELLETRTMTTSEIATALGFADSGALFRAFHRWTGASLGRAK